MKIKNFKISKPNNLDDNFYFIWNLFERFGRDSDITPQRKKIIFLGGLYPSSPTF